MHPLDREYESAEEMIKIFNVDPVKFMSFIMLEEIKCGYTYIYTYIYIHTFIDWVSEIGDPSCQ